MSSERLSESVGNVRLGSDGNGGSGGRLSVGRFGRSKSNSIESVGNVSDGRLGSGGSGGSSKDGSLHAVIRP